MKVIGLTGGIGSGKTTVAKIFETLDVPIYNSDLRARWIMENNLEIIQQIKNHFGSLSYDSKHSLNRSFIAKKVFKNPAETQWINNLIHPAVGLDFMSWSANQPAPFIIKESALLIEVLNQQAVDKIILVVSNEQLRIDRLKRRDQWTLEEIQKRMKAQLNDEQRSPYADYTIYNLGTQSIIRQTLNIYLNLKELFG